MPVLCRKSSGSRRHAVKPQVVGDPPQSREIQLSCLSDSRGGTRKVPQLPGVGPKVSAAATEPSESLHGPASQAQLCSSTSAMDVLPLAIPGLNPSPEPCSHLCTCNIWQGNRCSAQLLPVHQVPCGAVIPGVFSWCSLVTGASL